MIPAYAIFKLRPWEFDELSVGEFNDMIDAYNEMKESSRWETAYWVALLMSTQTSKPVQPKALLKPFSKPKTAADIIDEREEFFREFEAERQEIERRRKEEINGC